jgi:hypothetical protein
LHIATAGASLNHARATLNYMLEFDKSRKVIKTPSVKTHEFCKKDAFSMDRLALFGQGRPISDNLHNAFVDEDMGLDYMNPTRFSDGKDQRLRKEMRDILVEAGRRDILPEDMGERRLMVERIPVKQHTQETSPHTYIFVTMGGFVGFTTELTQHPQLTVKQPEKVFWIHQGVDEASLVANIDTVELFYHASVKNKQIPIVVPFAQTKSEENMLGNYTEVLKKKDFMKGIEVIPLTRSQEMLDALMTSIRGGTVQKKVRR